MPDILVQRGNNAFGNSGGTTSITAVSSLSSAFARDTSNRRTNVGPTTSGSNVEADDISGALRLTATDTITFARQAASISLSCRFAWEVWEYTGPPGGTAEFIVRGRFQVTLGSGTRSSSTAVSGVVDHNRCVAFVQGHLCSHTSDAADSLTSHAYVDSSNDLQVEKGGNNSNSVTVWVVVVEFTGSDWTIHHGLQEGGGSAVDSGTITLRDESDGVGGSTSSVSDWADALIVHQYRANLLAEVDDSIADTSCTYIPGGTNGEVDYIHNANHTDSASAGSRNSHRVFVIEHPDLVVTRYTDSQNAAGPMNVNVTSAGLTDLDHAAVEVSRVSSGNGTAYARGWCTAEITTLTNVELWVHRSGNTITTRIQVADLNAIEDSGGGVVTSDLDSSIPAPTMDSDGTVQGQRTGVLAAVVPVLVLDADGLGVHLGTVAATLPAPVAALDGVAGIPGELASSISAPTMESEGAVETPVSNVISALFAEANEATTTSSSFSAIATTAALASEDYLVVVTANTVAGNNSTCEIEARLGTTRYAFARWRAAFSGAPSSATGGSIQTAFLISGDGSSTVDVRHRRVDGTQTTTSSAGIACIPLGTLTENTHYWQSQATNGDSLTNPTAGSGWNGSGESVDVTPGTTGNFLIFCSIEGEFTSGDTVSDQSRMRCRVTEDPLGTPTSYNLQRNTIADPDIEGPETQIEGGHSWGQAAHGQRFMDVVELQAGTTYRFEAQWEGVAGTANTGYRRARVIVLDLSVWPEFYFSRDVEGVATQDYTLDTCAVSAPAGARDYVLIGGALHQNGTSFVETRMRLDPDGTPSDLGPPHGIALTDAGNTTADDYGIITAQANRQGVSTAFDIGFRFEAPTNTCRFNAEHGVFPGGTDDGVAGLTIAWGMETSTAAAEPEGALASTLAAPSAAFDGTVQGQLSGGLDAALPAPTIDVSGLAVHEGQLDASLPAPTAELDGTIQGQASGGLDASLPAPNLDADGLAVHEGQLDASLPAPAADLAADVQGQTAGQLDATLPAPVAALEGVAVHEGQLDATLPAPGMDSDGVVQGQREGTLDASIPAPVFTAEAQRNAIGALAADLPVLVLNADGTLQGVIVGTLDAAIDTLELDGSGDVQGQASGTVSASIPAPVADLEGVAVHEGQLDATIDAPVLDADGEARAFLSGDLAATLPAPVADLVGELQGVVGGVLGATLDPPTMAASGELQGQAAGDLAAEIGPLLLDAIGDARAFLLGELDASIPAPTLDAEGVSELTGSFGPLAAVIDALGMAASAVTQREGQLDASIPAPDLSALGLDARVGSVSASIPAPTAALEGQRVNLGSMGAALGVPTLDALGTQSNPGTFAAIIGTPSMVALGLFGVRPFEGGALVVAAGSSENEVGPGSEGLEVAPGVVANVVQAGDRAILVVSIGAKNVVTKGDR